MCGILACFACSHKRAQPPAAVAAASEDGEPRVDETSHDASVASVAGAGDPARESFSLRAIYESFERLAHRGPDASRFDVRDGGRLVLGFHRLAIVDVHPSAMQPLTTPTWPHITLLFNGEIYNAPELTREFAVDTHMDGEAIIWCYGKYGAEGLAKRLRGVFAFVLIDEKEHEVVVARDCFGVRPLYAADFELPAAGAASRGRRSTAAPTAAGVAPDLVRARAFASELCSFPDAWLPDAKPFPPGSQQRFRLDLATGGLAPIDLEPQRYYDIDAVAVADVRALATTPIVPVGGVSLTTLPRSIDDRLSRIRTSLEEAVRVRVEACERPIGCLLSGGLDSSLVAALLARCVLDTKGQRIHTYACGMPGGTDLAAARVVAEHIGSIHHEAVFTEEQFVEALPDVVRTLVSWDTTTIRASTGMYLVAQYIASKAESVVIFSGEGADEVAQGYVYAKGAPSAEAGDADSRRLLRDLQFFDVLRADRTTAAWGLELRVPFLDTSFVEEYLGLPAEWRQPIGGVEKWALRAAFDPRRSTATSGTTAATAGTTGIGLIPATVLWRPKEAFSDGVSSEERPWYGVVQEAAETRVSDAQLKAAAATFGDDAATPKTKEAYLYRTILHAQVPAVAAKGASVTRLVPYQWLPKWCGEVDDPSGRVLGHFVSSLTCGAGAEA